MQSYVSISADDVMINVNIFKVSFCFIYFFCFCIGMIFISDHVVPLQPNTCKMLPL